MFFQMYFLLVMAVLVVWIMVAAFRQQATVPRRSDMYLCINIIAN